ncbi:NfeD family protein [Salirhabdus salicampi]|uniref:NfeD family protein n=1 Tax=Salirhabdus salicampi TaxID=476102 RepID=UPI0020C38412|nr:NfeD family protein [Salirhabdus salicampi]MCP8616878.1 nodulation protein NfeD [Salirhabdus salicampi]
MTTSLMAFLLTFVGMAFLMGEVLVKLRGVGGIIGFSCIAFYFGMHLSPTYFWLATAVYTLAIFLIIVDGKLANDGTLSVIGGIGILVSIGLGASHWLVGIYGIIGVILGTLCSFLFLKRFPKRNFWGKVTLLDRLTSENGYNSIIESDKELVRKEGIAISDLRPSGVVEISGKKYSAVSNGQWITKNSSVAVTYVDGTKIVVEQVDHEQTKKDNGV